MVVVVVVVVGLAVVAAAVVLVAVTVALVASSWTKVALRCHVICLNVASIVLEMWILTKLWAWNSRSANMDCDNEGI